MDTFETVISAFCEDAGLALPPVKDGSVDFVVDGLCVSVQYRPDRGDCVMFTLPLYDAEPEPWLMYRALELNVNGARAEREESRSGAGDGSSGFAIRV